MTVKNRQVQEFCFFRDKAANPSFVSFAHSTPRRPWQAQPPEGEPAGSLTAPLPSLRSRPSSPCTWGSSGRGV